MSATGEAPATHYISTGYTGPEFAHMVPLQVWELDEAGQWQLVRTEPGDPEAVTDDCNAAGLEVTLEQVDAVYSGADVTDQEPFTAMGRLGLSIIQEAADGN